MPTRRAPSFAERRQRLQAAATDLADISAMLQRLREITEIVSAEAEQMAAAELRFAERRGDKRERRARE
jgi:hypothetical protein